MDENDSTAIARELNAEFEHRYRTDAAFRCTFHQYLHGLGVQIAPIPTRTLAELGDGFGTKH